MAFSQSAHSISTDAYIVVDADMTAEEDLRNKWFKKAMNVLQAMWQQVKQKLFHLS